MVITFHKYKLGLASKSMWIGPGYFTTTIAKSNHIICLSGPDDGIPWKLQVDWNRNIQRCHSNLESMEW